ncbi:hypothetical protein KY332_01375 [Candidatus Woesearchaeota archaeon]|nr:hypothetical protein [Candidatus Woesearchaeota archaeon]
MTKIGITDVPKPGERIPGEHDLVIGWFPEPLVPLEQRFLADNVGGRQDIIAGQEGWYIEGSLGTLPYDTKKQLIKETLEEIRQNPHERYLNFWKQIKGE